MNWIVAFSTPIFLANSSSGVYFLFGGAALLTVAVCIFWMPETRGKSLEEIDASFRKQERRIDHIELGDMPTTRTEARGTVIPSSVLLSV